MLERYFAGERIDFASVALDLGGVGPFHRAIYDATRSLGWGQTATYGDLARQAGSPGAARAVGQAMGHNPVPIIIPCHRVLAAGRKIGGFSAYGGALTKERLLALEGVHLGMGRRCCRGCCRRGGEEAAITIAFGAVERTRTSTPCGANPSSWCVYQFRHDRTRQRPAPLANPGGANKPRCQRPPRDSEL